MYRFTSGDWKRMPGDSKPRVAVEGDKDWPIVVMSSGASLEQTIANEELCADAPTMYFQIEKYCLLFEEMKEINEHKTFSDEEKNDQKRGVWDSLISLRKEMSLIIKKYNWKEIKL